ncbi:MAG: hypothetical protein AB8B62_20055 [Roseobacter sp.]
MTDLELQATALVEKAQRAGHDERMRLQPQIDHVITALTMQGIAVPRNVRRINNTLKDEALDDMFDNMPV